MPGCARSSPPSFREEQTVDAFKPAKSVLQEMSYSRTGRAPHYRLVSDEGPAHARQYVVEAIVDGVPLGQGVGRSRREAETEAAHDAIAALQQMKPD